MYQNVDELIKIMRKYQSTDKTTINKLIMDKGDDQDAETMKYLMRNPNWRNVYQQATEEITTKGKHSKYNYYEQFMTMTNDRGQKMMSAEDTATFIQKWCKEQSIPFVKLMTEKYAALAMVHPKKNAIFSGTK